jgi:hypothetical protein
LSVGTFLLLNAPARAHHQILGRKMFASKCGCLSNSR